MPATRRGHFCFGGAVTQSQFRDNLSSTIYG